MKGSKCLHERTELTYGFGRTYGYKGLGVITYCLDCGFLLNFFSDPEGCTKEEIEHNKEIRLKKRA